MSDQQFTDIHHHILYGLDDGAKSQNRMYEMLKLAAENGISRIVATPHVTPGVFEFDVEQYHTALAEAQAYCDENGLGIRMDAGAEILFSEQTCRFLRDGRAPTMVGTDRVLVEFSPDVSYTRLRDALEQICMSGFTPIVAHVERYYCISQSVKLAIQLKKELDIRYQMNCATVLSQSGFFERRFMRKMFKERQIDAIATDAHNISTRKVEMREAVNALKKICSPEYLTSLTDGSVLGEYDY